MKKLNIVIATPLIFPQIGGGAFYTDILSKQWEQAGHVVTVVPFGGLVGLPLGIRNIFYGFKLLPALFNADVVYVLDGFSVALPAVFLCHLLHKKVIVRIGGDFLWETYVNRTKEKILLSEFYNEERNFTFKESSIFDLTSFIFQHADVLVFSTHWQRDICDKAYSLDMSKVHVIENVYEDRTKRNIVPKNRIILSPSRNIFLKNKKALQDAFVLVKNRFFDATLDTQTSSHDELMQRISEAYIVVATSLSEVSPNLVLDAVSLGVPVVVTEDCGIKERLGELVVWVDPKKPESIAHGIEILMDARTYSEYMARMSKFSYVQSKETCAAQFLNLS